MRYHINYDGKILPCRAKVKSCPYGDERHAGNYEDLYYKYQDEYNNVNPSPELINKLKNGEPFFGIKEIDNEIATSDSPIELICSSLKNAIQNSNFIGLNKHEYEQREHAIDSCINMLNAGRTLPRSVPNSITEEAYNRWVKNHASIFSRQKYYIGTQRTWSELVDQSAELHRIEAKYQSTYKMSPEAKKEYQNDIKQDFNRWANVLNTRKLISQPMIVSEDDNEIVAKLNNMSNAELLSLYDDCTVSDNEIRNRLESVNHFKTNGIQQLSPQANDNLKKWYASARDAEKRYIVGSARRTLLAIYIANTLYKRKSNYGDLIYTVKEKE